MLRHRLDDRQGLRLPVRTVKDRDRQITAGNVPLKQHLAVVGERGDERRRQLRRAPCELDPQRRALAGGLDDDWKAQRLLDLGQRLAGAEHLAVLAVATVQGDKRDLRFRLLQAGDEIGADVDRRDLVAERAQRIGNPGSRFQRDLPLQ